MPAGEADLRGWEVVTCGAPRGAFRSVRLADAGGMRPATRLKFYDAADGLSMIGMWIGARTICEILLAAQKREGVVLSQSLEQGE
jgi:hypothetical protein